MHWSSKITVEAKYKYVQSDFINNLLNDKKICKNYFDTKTYSIRNYEKTRNV